MATPFAVKAVIAEEYVNFDTPADRIVADYNLSAQFAKRVNDRLPPPLRMSNSELNRITLNMRRKGEDNGGLPRLRGGHGPSRNYKAFGQNG